MNFPITKLPKPEFPPIKQKKIKTKKTQKVYANLDELLPKKFLKEYFNKN